MSEPPQSVESTSWAVSTVGVEIRMGDPSMYGSPFMSQLRVKFNVSMSSGTWGLRVASLLWWSATS
eukprot:398454-Rhodomonas_salina.2